MGWASAGEIFDPVAQSLIDLNADANTMRKVLGPLIRKLQDGDWDTEDESLSEFRHDPVIVQIFYEAGVGGTLDSDCAEGQIDYEERTDTWGLHCSGVTHGCLGTAPGTAKGHDSLVRMWAEHDQAEHEGDGKVADWMLINPAAGA